MKIQDKHLALSLAVVLAVGITTPGCKKTDSEKIGNDVKTTAQDTTAAAKDALSNGKDKAVELATNVSVAVKEGVQKADKMATNVAAMVKKATTNTLSDAKSVTTNVVNKVNDMIH